MTACASLGLDILTQNYICTGSWRVTGIESFFHQSDLVLLQLMCKHVDRGSVLGVVSVRFKVLVSHSNCWHHVDDCQGQTNTPTLLLSSPVSVPGTSSTHRLGRAVVHEFENV